jgi:hypothetical protein
VKQNKKNKWRPSMTRTKTLMTSKITIITLLR